MTPPHGALLVCGAASGVGKSTIVAALARSLRRRGAAVAPFKAQNMSNHAAVTACGGEVGRAQAMQAGAAGVDVTVDMNPILLKPSSDRTSHVVVLGREVDTTDAAAWGRATTPLKPVVLDAWRRLRQTHDIVVGEGAGGAAEINLLERDLVNLPFAAAAGCPTILVVDIDRGGAFAAAHGTIDLVPERLRATIGGIVINRFRGDPALLASGLRTLEARTGVPVLGVLPHLGSRPLLGTEDSLDVTSGAHLAHGDDPRSAPSPRPIRVGVVRLPHLANPSDIDPLTVEPDVAVSWVTTPSELVDVELIVLPGSRATVADLDWIRATGIADALAATSGDIIGICAGAQMLGRHIHDGVESDRDHAEGLGLMDAVTEFARPKVVRRVSGRLTTSGTAVRGYQIHWGRTETAARPWIMLDQPTGQTGQTGQTDGGISPDGRVRTTSMHGIFDHDGARHEVLADIAARHGRVFRPALETFSRRLEAQHEHLADWFDAAVDTDRVDALIESAVAPGMEPGWC